jgi:hypothetical protein
MKKALVPAMGTSAFALLKRRALFKGTPVNAWEPRGSLLYLVHLGGIQIDRARGTHR